MNINRERNRLNALSLDSDTEIINMFDGGQAQYKYPRHMTKREAIKSKYVSNCRQKKEILSAKKPDMPIFYCNLIPELNYSCGLKWA